MPKPGEYSESELITVICYRTMSAHNFDYERRLNWEIWASRDHECPECRVGPYKRCVNLSDLSLNKEPRENKRPHDRRINWNQLLEGLKLRGYYRPVIEAQVRRGLE